MKTHEKRLNGVGRGRRRANTQNSRGSRDTPGTAEISGRGNPSASETQSPANDDSANQSRLAADSLAASMKQLEVKEEQKENTPGNYGASGNPNPYNHMAGGNPTSSTTFFGHNYYPTAVSASSYQFHHQNSSQQPSHILGLQNPFFYT